MGKTKSLDQCKTTKDLSKFCESNGLKRLRVSGGHAIYGNGKGSLPISTHEKEVSKGLLHGIKKQIMTLIGIIAGMFIIVSFLNMI